MMEITEIQDKVMEEIKLVPKERLPELYDFIHFFRLGLETAGDDSGEVMRFAGCWRDMTDEEFKEFSDEIAERRKASSRRTRETIID